MPEAAGTLLTAGGPSTCLSHPIFFRQDPCVHHQTRWPPPACPIRQLALWSCPATPGQARGHPRWSLSPTLKKQNVMVTPQETQLPAGSGLPTLSQPGTEAGAPWGLFSAPPPSRLSPTSKALKNRRGPWSRRAARVIPTAAAALHEAFSRSPQGDGPREPPSVPLTLTAGRTRDGGPGFPATLPRAPSSTPWTHPRSSTRAHASPRGRAREVWKSDD